MKNAECTSAYELMFPQSSSKLSDMDQVAAIAFCGFGSGF